MGVNEQAGRAVGNDGAGKFGHRDHAAFDVQVAVTQAGNEVAAVRLNHLSLFAKGMADVRADVGNTAAANENVGVGDNFAAVNVDPAAVLDDEVGRLAAHGHVYQPLCHFVPGLSFSHCALLR